MLRAFLPVGILMFAGVSLEPAEAAPCPAGQFYRVSLKVCQPRAAAMKQIKGEKPVATPKGAKLALASRPEKSAEKTVIPSSSVRSARVILPPSRPSDLADNEAETTRGYTANPADAALRAKASSTTGKPDSPPSATTSFSPYGALSPFGAMR